MIKDELWSKVFIAVASSSNINDKSICASWADYAAEEFEKRFPENKESTMVLED